MSFHCSSDNSHLFVNEKKIFKFKTVNKNVNFPIQFCLGSIYEGLAATESKKVPLKGNLYHFPINYNVIVKADILNTHKCLMVKNNLKIMPSCIKKTFIGLLNFGGSLAGVVNASNHRKCISLNNQQCIILPTHKGLCYNPFTVNLHKSGKTINV